MRKDFEICKARLLHAKRLQVIRNLKKKYEECNARLVQQEIDNATLQKQNKYLQDEQKSLKSDIEQIKIQNNELRDYITVNIVADFNFEFLDDHIESAVQPDSTAATVVTPEKPKRYHNKRITGRRLQQGTKVQSREKIKNNSRRTQKRSNTSSEDAVTSKKQRTRRTSPRKK